MTTKHKNITFNRGTVRLVGEPGRGRDGERGKVRVTWSENNLTSSDPYFHHHMYIYIYIYIYIYTHTHIYMYTYTQLFVYYIVYRVLCLHILLCK